ncbi:MAG: helix-turn-helix domain-containing protein, partial [Gammaproteobacteria bacterium]|nr:helix-turn-helix domain-containing protein [Gammaproteobacteria bacterium]
MSEIDKGAEEPVVNESGMDESEVSEIPSVSRILQETRESLGLTRKDIADQLFLAEKQIDSIEEEKFDNFPKKIFVKGYLRSYARIVGLSGEDIVKLYEAAYETRAEEAVEEKIAHQKEIELLASRKIIRTGLISLVILIILMLLLWLLVGNDEPERAAEEGETGSMVDAPVLQVDDGSLDADISLETGQTTGAGVAEPETIEH